MSQARRICLFPVAVSPGPYVKVALGAHRLIMRSMSFVEVALWKFFSIWSIDQRSARRCSACSEADFELEHPPAPTMPAGGLRGCWQGAEDRHLPAMRQ